MKIEFVDQDQLRKAGRRETLPWTEFFEELYKHPNSELWAAFPIKLKTPSAAYAAAKRFKDMVVTCKNTDDGWLAFAKYAPKEEEVF
jgi:hypothetical protein